MVRIKISRGDIVHGSGPDALQRIPLRVHCRAPAGVRHKDDKEHKEDLREKKEKKALPLV
jgi:hypothetical protein